MKNNLYIGSAHNKKGFALIATISVMVLLVLVALAMLSLSTVELRSNNNNKDSQIARANARTALMLAIAELQKSTGPDTRITAPADALGVSGGQTDNHVRQLTGVWRSWEGLNQDTSTGKPIVPDYESKERSYDEGSSADGRFIRWLISDETQDLYDATNPPTLIERGNTIPLLSGRLLPDGSDEEVHIVPTEIADTDKTGAYAWWIQGENTKVRVRPAEEPDSDLASVEQMFLSPGPSGDGFGIDDTSDSNRALTQQSLTFLKSGTDEPTEFFHDLTVHSQGLLTNVANGGWKRDLSLFSENFASVPEPFSSFTLSPGEVYEAGKLYVGAGSESPLIYPWGDRTATFPDTVSWAALVDYMTYYKRLETSGNPVTQFGLYSSKTHTDWTDIVRHLPVITRIHFVISLTAMENEGDGSGDTHVPAILINPVITMWNPYSIAIDTSTFPNLQTRLNDAACPVTFDFQVGSTSVSKDLAKIIAHQTSGKSNLTCNIPIATPNYWLPGEVRTFSPVGSVVANKTIRNSVSFEAGYRPDSGLRYPLLNSSNATFAAQPASTNFSVSAGAINATFSGPNIQGTGFSFTQRLGVGSNVSTNNFTALLDLDDAQRALGEEIELTATPSASLSSLADEPQPILSIILGHRYAKDANPQRDDIVVNGVHNMNPAVGFMIAGQPGASETDMKARMDGHTYSLLLYPVNSFADPGMPSGITDELEGYVGSGFGAVDGLANLILLEIPSRPIQTIGALQHFNVNACDHEGPYTLNALGNSRTSPFIASDNIRVVPLGLAIHGHDHSYAINHVMMDDWFVSSITPDMSDWSATEDRSIDDVYADHLSAEESLPNDYYRPVKIYSDADAVSEAADFLAENDAWEKVAAELQVEGMFNVNSTSVLAWAMFLKRNFNGSEGPSLLNLNDSIPGNSEATATLLAEEGTPFPRTTLTPDPNAGSGGGSLLSQPIRFTDEEIMSLASEIVDQVKMRGPFLSLSEFYNRRLEDNEGQSSGADNLALAGAVEFALMSMAAGEASENPFAELQAQFTDTASKKDMLGNDLEYPFPAAAEGNPAYGFPGWTRQADVLRSVSGLLSPRDDTFIIRAYGASKDASGNTTAEAWCEAVVTRTPDFVTGDDKYLLPTDVTQPFGRKYIMTQFRWLSPDEV